VTVTVRRGWPFVPDPDVGSVPAKPAAPRCHTPMQPYEGVWGALLDGVVCGRPAGHSGQHRSVQSLDRERSKKRWERYSEQRQDRRRRARLSLADQLAIAVCDASEEARWDALGR
jgi:hypothetical protein